MRRSTQLGAALDAAAEAASGIYPFDHPHPGRARELAGLLGGKGAGLAEMTSALGIKVPPGFTVSVPVCHHYLREGWPADLDEALSAHVRFLGERMGRHLGDPADPLLVAVRSGAPVSMPGMLDTVLNLGLNERTVEGLARTSGDERFAWDTYRRFLDMYATTVMGVPARERDLALCTTPVVRLEICLACPIRLFPNAVATTL